MTAAPAADCGCLTIVGASKMADRLPLGVFLSNSARHRGARAVPDAIMTLTETLGIAPALKLAALDAEDLAVVSAHLQDATVRATDMAYLPRAKRFALVASRFDWAAAPQGRFERCRTGLHFERVFKVARTGFTPEADVTLNLLAVSFAPGDPPSGMVMLHFSGGAAVRLDVECLEAALSDIGPRWPAEGKPGHALAAERA